MIRKTLTDDEILAKLDAHTAWLNGEPGGARADFSRTDLSNSTLFRKRNLMNANFEDAWLTNADISDAYFSCAYLRYTSLNGATAVGTKFSNATLFNTYFTDANLERADFTSCTLDHCCLLHANLDRADFDNCRFIRTTLRGLTLKNALRQHTTPQQHELLLRIARHLRANPEFLVMDEWHSNCGTTHCLAGWAIAMSSEGPTLEWFVGAENAGYYLLGAEALSHFYDSEDEVLDYLRGIVAAAESPTPLASA